LQRGIPATAMKQLYTARDRIEAQLLKDFLSSWHIDTVIQGDYLSGAAGELPALQFPVLWVVDERDLQRGRELIDLFQQRQSGPAWHCPCCGEWNEGQFQVCWQCASPCPEEGG
jgi:hypothetical protein